MPDHSTVKISFLGDISLNNHYESDAALRSRAFNDISPILQKSDFVVGNLECFCKGKGSNELKVPRIQTSSEALECLKNLNLGLVSLANNHVYDNLKDGFDKTCEKLNELDINYMGAGGSVLEASSAFLVDVKGKNVGFLNYVTADTNPSIPLGAGVYVNEYERNKIVGEIKGLKSQADIVILLLHWGGDVEGFDYPMREQRIDAAAFVDAGADAIIGHHSHTWQPVEVISGKPVFYSLGNFCFDNIAFGDRLYYMSSFKSHLVTLMFKDGGDR